VLELAFPRTAEPETAEMPLEPDDVVNLGWHELRMLAASMTVETTGDAAADSDLPLRQLPAVRG
jgi:hypothetical protein